MKAKGFTLIELMIVICIIAILALLAVPSISNIIRRQQVSGEANVLFSLVYLAQSEAIKLNSVVTICKSNDADLCGGNGSDGWIVFQDNDKDGSRDA
jgi:type IV fimbrial biogenesis protein FimT